MSLSDTHKASTAASGRVVKKSPHSDFPEEGHFLHVHLDEEENGLFSLLQPSDTKSIFRSSSSDKEKDANDHTATMHTTDTRTIPHRCTSVRPSSPECPSSTTAPAAMSRKRSLSDAWENFSFDSMDSIDWNELHSLARGTPVGCAGDDNLLNGIFEMPPSQKRPRSLSTASTNEDRARPDRIPPSPPVPYYEKSPTPSLDYSSEDSLTSSTKISHKSIVGPTSPRMNVLYRIVDHLREQTDDPATLAEVESIFDHCIRLHKEGSLSKYRHLPGRILEELLSKMGAKRVQRWYQLSRRKRLHTAPSVMQAAVAYGYQLAMASSLHDVVALETQLEEGASMVSKMHPDERRSLWESVVVVEK